MGGRLTPKARNQRLYDRLCALLEDPHSAQVREDWIIAAADLAAAVLKTQFVSQRESPDSEDLLQASLLEFHRVGDRLALLTQQTGPDNLFRILYSVAKFSMLRELSRLRKGPLGNKACVLNLNVVLDDDCDGVHPFEEPDVSLDLEHRDRYVKTELPRRLITEIDQLNVYSRSDWEAPVRFVALQRIRGRYVSSTFVNAMWAPPNVDLLIRYADFLARCAVLRVASCQRVKKQVSV